MDKEICYQLINKLHFFSAFTEEEKRHLSTLDSQVYKHPNHEKIIKQGDIGTHFYVILQGSVEVHRGDGFSTKIAELEPGDVFGEIGYLSKRARTTSIIACGNDTITLKFGRDLGYALKPEIHTKLNDVLISILVNRLEGMDDKLLNCSSGALCPIRRSLF